MKKQMIRMLCIVGGIFGIIFGYQAFKNIMMKKYMTKGANPAITVSSGQVFQKPWQKEITASGSLRAQQGVDVTPEIAGAVRKINFSPGKQVKKGSLLVQLNNSTELADLQALIAKLNLAQLTYDRNKAQFDIESISKQTLQNSEADLKNLQAQVLAQQALVDKKTIRAPFSGKLGISRVNPGQYINPGEPIVTLQTLDPLYVDFYLPQQEIKEVGIGRPITLTSDSYPGESFSGKITTINPIVDVKTRNIQVEATLSNPKHKLLPGMFATVTLPVGKPVSRLTLPQTAVSFNPYGEIVYRIHKENNKLIATQRFVTVGEKEGDLLVIVKGLEENDVVVTTGQNKLKNGNEVIINNSLSNTQPGKTS